MVLYADVLFAINFSMDFLALIITSRLMHRKISRIRIVVASLLGALYGVLEVIVNISLALKIPLCVIVALIMVKMCFREKGVKNTVTMCAIYVFISATLGGVMSILYTFFNNLLAEFISNYSYELAYSSSRTVIIIGLTALVSMALMRAFKKKKEVRFVNASVLLGSHAYEISCLCDSGNLLKEPFSGRSVILVSKFCPLGREIEGMEDIYKRYIPYRDVNGEGMLKGVIPQKIEINNVSVDAVIAPAENENFGGYDALISIELV